MQFTPDLMPSDVTGSLIFDARTAAFEFREAGVHQPPPRRDQPDPEDPGLAARWRSDRSLWTVGPGLPEPFLVAATQNPIEYEGTYLPEAQLDRFLFKLTVPLPTATRNWA